MLILITLLTFILMEPMTWLIHKYVMHGFLWVLHKDHHDHNHEGELERNDLFFIIFALPAIALMYWGAENDRITFLVTMSVVWHVLSAAMSFWGWSVWSPVILRSAFAAISAKVTSPNEE